MKKTVVAVGVALLSGSVMASGAYFTERDRSFHANVTK